MAVISRVLIYDWLAVCALSLLKPFLTVLG